MPFCSSSRRVRPAYSKLLLLIHYVTQTPNIPKIKWVSACVTCRSSL
jgi:hypothetical protein